jgi:2'-hydroxyisoflavone reductase
MRLLVLGGTLFLGRHLVVAARDRGHEVTLFNRGRTAPGLFADVEEIHGDRESALGALGDRRWDAVIDTSGYVPRVVATAARTLADRAGHYTFVSSISAYGSFAEAGLTEDAPAASPPEPESEDVASHYGALKAACEREVRAVFGDRALIVRPGLIAGPHDPTERFTYWVRRLAESGPVLVPDAPVQPVQLVDARDLAEWMISLSERRASGVFNATGPDTPLSFGALIERIRDAVAGSPELVPVAEDVLAAAGVEPWQDLPLWLDLERHPDLAGFLAVDVQRACAAGLRFRSLESTAVDTLRWVRERDGVRAKVVGVPLAPAGLPPEREAELLSRRRGA